MIKYLRSCVSFQELKKEISLVIEITNCPYSCKGCHSPELQQDIGAPLTIEVLNGLIFRNSIDKKPLFTCILFMGGEQHEGFKGLLDYIKNNYELKTALFTGAEEVRDDIKSLLNYVKTGRYIESLGGLESSITNQKLVELRSNKMKLNFKLSENSKLPTKADVGAVGYDLYAAEAVVIPARKWKLVSTGLSWQPESNNVEMQIRPRSGLAYKYGITVLNSPGTIDPNFTGNIGVLLMNNSDKDYEIAIGDRIAQAVFRKTDDFELQIVDSLDETERNDGGFGSSGK